MENNGWEQVSNQDEIIKWDVPGKEIEGKLLIVKKIEVAGDRMATMARIQTVDKVVAFFAPTMLEQLIDKVPPESEVNIQYVKDRKTAKGYTIKEFSVKHRPLADKELASLY